MDQNNLNTPMLENHRIIEVNMDYGSQIEILDRRSFEHGRMMPGTGLGNLGPIWRRAAFIRNSAISVVVQEG
jgi:hypothetical protein